MAQPETFPFGHLRKAGAAGEVTHRVKTAQFGDGYSQRVPDGINNKVQRWPLAFEGSESEMAPIVEFFDRHEGAKAFYWTPPFSTEPKLFVVAGYRPTSIGGGLYSVTADLQQTFAP